MAIIVEGAGGEIQGEAGDEEEDDEVEEAAEQDEQVEVGRRSRGLRGYVLALLPERPLW